LFGGEKVPRLFCIMEKTKGAGKWIDAWFERVATSIDWWKYRLFADKGLSWIELQVLLFNFGYFIWITWFIAPDHHLFQFFAVLNRTFWSSFLGVAFALHLGGFIMPSCHLRILSANAYAIGWFMWFCCFAFVDRASFQLPTSVVMFITSAIVAVRLQKHDTKHNEHK
jgi:hypothetical protein